ncbi:MAG: 23S rRNA (guanosine(2251)-2'-O)-methyltransferase RlmB [Actinomycetes bacterium]|jgi:23S rRNA (guanosine2251-2'-O)-methyltransferase|nr:23S rRNA (guanosine(2251)-2'-O)-methyltransferase RlmB [Actinomycetes bacterium]
MYLEGKNAVLEALRAGTPLQQLLLFDGARPDGALNEIVRRAGQASVPVTRMSRRKLDELSERGKHQGVMAQVAPFEYTPLPRILDAVDTVANALIIVLDHVVDPVNVGAIARTAEVVGAAALVIADRRAAAITPAAHKAAAGALNHLPVARVTNITRVIEQLQQAGFWVAGADGSADTLAWDAALTGKIALVMGSEGTGLARLVRERCDFLVKLPQHGRIGSLNVSQATCALAYEWLRQNRVT